LERKKNSLMAELGAICTSMMTIYGCTLSSSVLCTNVRFYANIRFCTHVRCFLEFSP
jgi:hypothetical protein